jgi:hypothetical protein
MASMPMTLTRFPCLDVYITSNSAADAPVSDASYRYVPTGIATNATVPLLSLLRSTVIDGGYKASEAVPVEPPASSTLVRVQITCSDEEGRSLSSSDKKSAMLCCSVTDPADWVTVNDLQHSVSITCPLASTASNGSSPPRADRVVQCME